MPTCPFCDKSVAASATSCSNCGAPLNASQPADTEARGDDLDQRIRALLDDDRKIEAIKLYREETGVGLAEAKEAVEALQAGGPLLTRERPETPDADDLEREVLRLLAAGQKIQAIKLYRETKGGGLKDAKDAVESLGARHGIASRGTGCAGVLLLLLGAAIYVWVA